MVAASFILHVDADAFYASVEQVLQPSLKGKAVIVGGGDRGVVSSASYQARRRGVHSAMPIVQARKLCPHAVFLEPNFSAYKEFSMRMFGIMGNYPPIVEATSIDEGYVDLTGTLKLHKAPAWEVAHRMLCEIRSALTINVSGGLAGTKSWAKMATSLAKPNGLLYLEPAQAGIILGFLPASAIPGGRYAQKKTPQRALSWYDSGDRVPRKPRRNDTASSWVSRNRRVTDRDQRASNMVGAGLKSSEDNLDVMNYDADLQA